MENQESKTERAALRKPAQWGKVLFLMVFSLEIVASALVAIYIVWLFTAPFSVINGIVMIFAGVVGFALGAVIFWRFSVKFSQWRSDSRR